MAVLLGNSLASAQGFQYLEVDVVGEDGKPMAGVTVEVRMDRLEFPMQTNNEGKISLNTPTDSSSVSLKIDQEGYQQQRVRWVNARDIPARYTIRMELGKPLEGLVVDSSGKPIAGAEIYVATAGEKLAIWNGRQLMGREQKPTVSDEQGKFTLDYQPPGVTLVCVSDAGWLHHKLSGRKQNALLELKLNAWARLEVTSLRGKEPVNKGGVYVTLLSSSQASLKHVSWILGGSTDEQGVYSAERVVPGTVLAGRSFQYDRDDSATVSLVSHGVTKTIVAGQTSKIQVGGRGRQVVGKVLLPDGEDSDAVDAVELKRTGFVELRENNVVDLALRTAVFEYGKLLSQSSVFNPRDRVPPSADPNYQIRYLAKLQPDGSFAIEDVPEGPYRLSATLWVRPGDSTTGAVFRLADIACTVLPANEGSPAVYDLGEYVFESTRAE